MPGMYKQLELKIHVFCYRCKLPRPLDWTNGSEDVDGGVCALRRVENGLDMESWSNVKYGDFYEFKEIGSGGYGTVYTVSIQEENVLVCQKLIRRRNYLI